MNGIPCDVCLDLMPLVQDGVASAASEALVKQHLEHCPRCRAIFGGAAWVATSAYFVGMAAIIISGIMLKKTRMFAGEPAPFVMELPAYHLPTVGNVLRSMWERGWSFIKKAGTIILLSTIVIWFTT